MFCHGNQGALSKTGLCWGTEHVLTEKCCFKFIKIHKYIYIQGKGCPSKFAWSDSIVCFGLHYAVEKAEMSEYFNYLFVLKTDLVEESKWREEIKTSSFKMQSCSEMSPVRLEDLLNRPHINAGRALTLAEGAGKPEGMETEPSLRNKNAGKQRISWLSQSSSEKSTVRAGAAGWEQPGVPRDCVLLAPSLLKPL